MPFILDHVGIFIVFGLSSLFVGGVILTRLYQMDEVGLSVAMGLGGWSVITFVFGVLGLLRHNIFVELFSAITIVFGIIYISDHRQSIRMAILHPKSVAPAKWNVISLLLGVVIIIFFVQEFKLALYPPTAWDAISYHLAASRQYVQHHRLMLVPYVRFPVFPQGIEMLFTFAMLIYDGISARLISLLMFVSLGAIVWSAARRLIGNGGAQWAIIAFLSSPLVLWLASSGYIDIGAALFAGAAVYVFLKANLEKRIPWYILSGVFMGMGIGAKYNDLIFVPIMGGILLVRIFRSGHRWRISELLAFLVPTILVGGPWYIRNYYYSGNPFFPFFGRVFGYPSFWTKQDNIGLQTDLLVAHGIGKSALSLLKLPLALIVNQRAFLLDYGAGLSPFLVITFVLFPFIGGPSKHKIWKFWIISLLFVLVWFYSAQIVRYITPLYFTLCLIFGWSLENIMKGVYRNIALGLAVLVVALFPFRFVTSLTSEPLPLNTSQRNTYLSAHLPSWPAINWLNEHAPNRVVYSIRNENMGYFYNGTFIGDWFGPGRYSQVLGVLNLDDSEILRRKLAKFRAAYLVINLANLGHNVNLDSIYFRQVYRDSTNVIFRIQHAA